MASFYFREYKGHLIAWSAFICYEVMVVAALHGRFNSFWDYLGHYALHIILFYCHARFVLPLALQKKKNLVWLLPILVAAEVAGYVALTYVLEFALTRYLQVELMRPLVFDYLYWLRSIWRSIYFMGFATGYFFLRNYLQEQKRADLVEKQHLLHIIEKQRLQHELIRSQNAFLKAQINPHFLFNTLNYIYNSVRKTSAEAADTVMSLSQMMRYALRSESELQETDLLEEIGYLEHLVSIHQIRHNNKLQIELHYSDNLAGVRFIPLVLITLTENVFKHGDLSRDTDPARIHISLEGEALHIFTQNLKSASRSEGHRIGLDNIQKRLFHAYGERASFTAYSTSDGYFITKVEVIDPGSLTVHAATVTEATTSGHAKV